MLYILIFLNLFSLIIFCLTYIKIKIIWLYYYITKYLVSVKDKFLNTMYYICQDICHYCQLNHFKFTLSIQSYNNIFIEDKYIGTTVKQIYIL